MLDEIFDGALHVSRDLIVLAGGLGIIGAVIYRAYKAARTIEKIFENSEDEKKAREKLASDLKSHIEMEESRDTIRDQQFLGIVSDLKEITREIRPNGGSSIKDVINETRDMVSQHGSRIAVLEERTTACKTLRESMK